MCGGSSSPPPVVMPAAPVAPAPVQATPQAQDPAVQQSREDDRLRRLRAQQANDTLLTGGAGVTGSANTATKSLFGQ